MRALSALPRDDFLMGRVRSRDGRVRFRLDLDRLLQTEGNLGDVLARLIDAAGDAPDASVDAEVQRFANTEIGRAMIGDMGRERALQAIREHMIQRRRGANA